MVPGPAGPTDEDRDMTDPDDDLRQAIALFRYGVIADLVHLPVGTPGTGATMRAKAERTYAIRVVPFAAFATDGARVIVDREVDGAALGRVLSVLAGRAQCCEPPHASIATTHGTRLAKCSRNFARVSFRSTISPVSMSTQCSWNTRFAVSTPTTVLLVFILDPPACL